MYGLYVRRWHWGLLQWDQRGQLKPAKAPRRGVVRFGGSLRVRVPWPREPGYIEIYSLHTPLPCLLQMLQVNIFELSRPMPMPGKDKKMSCSPQSSTELHMVPSMASNCSISDRTQAAPSKREPNHLTLAATAGRMRPQIRACPNQQRSEHLSTITTDCVPSTH